MSDGKADDKVVDFQHWQLKSLGDKYNLLVDYCRENLSTQGQVHKAVLKLVHARNLEQLLEIIAIDLPIIFDVDVVRIAMESEIAIDTAFGEECYSGMVFVDVGTTDTLFGAQRNVICSADAHAEMPFNFRQVFVDCDGLIESCALIRMRPENIDKDIILALGSREKERFKSGQSAEALHFLAQVVSLQLDNYLEEFSGTI